MSNGLIAFVYFLSFPLPITYFTAMVVSKIPSMDPKQIREPAEEIADHAARVVDNNPYQNHNAGMQMHYDPNAQQQIYQNQPAVILMQPVPMETYQPQAYPIPTQGYPVPIYSHSQPAPNPDEPGRYNPAGPAFTPGQEV